MSIRPSPRWQEGLSGKARAFQALALGFCFGVAGCRSSSVERAAIPSDFGQSDSVPIILQSQATVRDALRIGLGFVTKGDFPDARGIARNGLIAGLWIYVREDSSKDQIAQVHVGQRFEVAGYRIFVEGIQGGESGSVLLRVSIPEQLSPAQYLAPALKK